MQRIFKNITAGVVHTEKLYNDVHRMGIKNVAHIEYPNFENADNIDREVASSRLKLPNSIPIILAVGGTRVDKGLDILLEAMQKVNSPFHLLVAGKEEDFNRNFIEKSIETYTDKVTLILKFLTEEEYSLCINAANIIVLPYRKIFDGASGPLTNAVWLRKTIVGPNHGSLGELIEGNKLGITFESENPNELAKGIDAALMDVYSWSEKAEKYRTALDPKSFIIEYMNIYRNL